MQGSAIRLIATDVDGTLLNSRGVIPERNLEAIHAAQRQGITVAICSGRFPENVYVLMQDYGVRCPIIGTNGAKIIDENLRVLSESYMQAEAAAQTVETLVSLGAHFFMFCGRAICTSHTGVPHHSELSYGDRIRALGLAYYHGPADARRLAMQGAVQKFFVRDTVSLETVQQHLAPIPGIDLTQSGANNVEVMPAGVDKGKGLEALARALGVPLSQTMALGDEKNDLPMLRAAGYGVAMANGSPEARAAARFVTASNDECGFAQAIRRFALHEE